VESPAVVRYAIRPVRGLILSYDTFKDLSLLLEVGGDEQELELPCPDGLRDGEWVLATFSIGSDAISVASCVVDRGDGLRLAFNDRDWQMLWQFANADDPPSLPPPSLAMPAFDLRAPPGTSVLVIDDDADLQNVVGAMLRGAGFAVGAVSSAEEAFDDLRRSRPNLVVLDWNLPGMSGVDFCRRLRKDSSLARLPVLFLTAHSTTQDVVTAFAAGADDFVSKPFRGPELAARVLGLIRRASMAPPSSRRV
jgi:two-component system, OmpR family, phosphate regulon response regulator PhoB